MGMTVFCMNAISGWSLLLALLPLKHHKTLLFEELTAQSINKSAAVKLGPYPYSYVISNLRLRIIRAAVRGQLLGGGRTMWSNIISLNMQDILKEYTNLYVTCL